MKQPDAHMLHCLNACLQQAECFLSSKRSSALPEKQIAEKQFSDLTIERESGRTE